MQVPASCSVESLHVLSMRILKNNVNAPKNDVNAPKNDVNAPKNDVNAPRSKFSLDF